MRIFDHASLLTGTFVMALTNAVGAHLDQAMTVA